MIHSELLQKQNRIVSHRIGQCEEIFSSRLGQESYSFDFIFFVRRHFIFATYIFLNNRVQLEMESKVEKTERYYAYLLNKRDLFIDNLTRIGAKLMNLHDENYDLARYIDVFVPSRLFLMRKIEEQVRESKISLIQDQAGPGFSDLDCRFIEAMKDELMELGDDFMKLRTATDPNDINKHEEEEKQPDPIAQAKPTEKKRKEAAKPTSEVDETPYLHQIINPGEMSKIFVQKSRIDVVRSMTEKPDFDDDNIETIYIYRSKKC